MTVKKPTSYHHIYSLKSSWAIVRMCTILAFAVQPSVIVPQLADLQNPLLTTVHHSTCSALSADHFLLATSLLHHFPVTQYVSFTDSENS